MAKQRIDKKILTAQVIHDDFSRFLLFMPNPNVLEGGALSSYETYRQMRNDPRIKSLLNLLKTTALNLPMHITRGAETTEEVHNFIASQPIFTSKLYRIAKRILSALDYGFSITEAVWKETDGEYTLDNLITRKPERFLYDSMWNCYLTQNGEKRLLDDPYKWLEYQHDPDDENPYGTPVLKCVYWPWKFKQAGYDFWAMATEKFSVKTILAIFEMAGSAQAVRERSAELAELLQGFSAGSGGGIGNVKDIKEIGNTGTAIDFPALIAACDVQIAYGLTAQSVATNNPDRGTQALGTVSAEMFYGDAKGIALELQGILQKAINWAVELRFGKDAAPPIIEFDTERKASLTDVMSAVDRGIPVSLQALYDQYKLPKPHDEGDSFVKSSPSGFDFADGGTGKKKRFSIWR